MSRPDRMISTQEIEIIGVADFGYELFCLQFLKTRLKLTFRYVQN
jgi:hypothetical protein